MSKLKTAEREYNLPELYRRFYHQCEFSLPDNLVGTDLVNNYGHSDLRTGAEELLEEDGIKNFLDPGDFVFMMHQGYMFWYFKANGESDPIVSGYYEGKLKPDIIGRFSSFVKEYDK